MSRPLSIGWVKWTIPDNYNKLCQKRYNEFIYLFQFEIIS